MSNSGAGNWWANSCKQGLALSTTAEDWDQSNRDPLRSSWLLAEIRRKEEARVFVCGGLSIGPSVVSGRAGVDQGESCERTPRDARQSVCS